MLDVKEKSSPYQNTRLINCKGRVEVKLHPFLTSGLDGGSGQLLTPACSTHEERATVPSIHGGEEKNSCPYLGSNLGHPASHSTH